jgi:tellurite resistance protein TerC
MDIVISLLAEPFLGKALWLWLVFLVIVVALLAIDLGILNRDDHVIGVRESLLLSGGYIAVACLYGLWIAYEFGGGKAADFFTGFFVEKSLSLDNIFVISLIFGYLAIPREYQHRVLFWGILGVIVMRGVMIAAGTALVSQFHWVLYIFAAFLVVTGLRMLFAEESEHDIGNHPVLRFVRRRFRVTKDLHGTKFLVKQEDARSGRMAWHVTPLFVALVLVESADLVFAVDSIPAIFAITTDPFIIYTSNIFAILGLRALYFALAALVARFRYLKYALASVLIFIGAKLYWNSFVEKLDPMISLSVVLTLLALGIVTSLLRKEEPQPQSD